MRLLTAALTAAAALIALLAHLPAAHADIVGPTQVATPNGTVAVEKVAVGDSLLAYGGPNAPQPSAVTFASSGPAGTAIFIVAGDQNLIATSDQPLLVEGERVVSAGDLVPGQDTIATPGGTVPILLVSVGAYDGMMKAVSFGPLAPASSIAGHLLLANGLLVGDYALQRGAEDDPRPTALRSRTLRGASTAADVTLLPARASAAGLRARGRCLGRVFADMTLGQAGAGEGAAKAAASCRRVRDVHLSRAITVAPGGQRGVLVECPPRYRIARTTVRPRAGKLAGAEKTRIDARTARIALTSTQRRARVTVAVRCASLE